MSNDDFPESLRDFINGLDPEVLPRVIATLCPTFNDQPSLPLLLDVLATLKRKYDVFFFVLQHKGKNPKETIADDEIEKLERYGTVEVFSPEGAEPPTIARAFKRFVRQYA